MADLRTRSEVGAVSALITVVFYGIYSIVPPGLFHYIADTLRHATR